MAENVRIQAQEVVRKTLDNLAKSPSVNLTEAGAGAIKPAIIKEMSSVIANQTNQEPWYQSNVTLGIFLTAAATVIKPWAPDIVPFLQDPDTVNAIITVIQGLGLLWSFAGRWWIKKPLGE